MLKLSVISDIHHGPDRGTKMGSRAMPLLDNFFAHIQKVDPDFAVELGHRISDVDRDTDLALLQKVAQKLSQIAISRARIN